jgi:hypothetical protein
MFGNFNYKPADPRDLTSFVDAREYVHKFEEILKGWNISIESGSELESVCLLIQDMEDRRQKKSSIEPMEDIRPSFRKACGLIEFVKTFVDQNDIRELNNFIPHIELLNNAKSAGAQNVKVLSDDSSNKIFELYVALICMRIGKNVELASPKDNIGDNPDVLADIEGRKWGFACKVMNGSSNMLTLFDRWEEAAKQIQKSPADIGCTFFNLRNWIDHDGFWPILNLKEYKQGQEPVYGAVCFDVIVGYLQFLANNSRNDFIEENESTNINKVLQDNPKVLPAILAFMQSTGSMISSVGPIVTTVGILSIWPFRELDANDLNALTIMNASLHHRF